MKRAVVKVAAAVIEKKGYILIGQRQRNDRHPLKWEFPGGKVEAGESPRSGLARELREELGIEARIGPEIERYEHSYRNRATLLLIFFRVSEFIGEPKSLAFERIDWVERQNLPLYDFLDGDIAFVRRLAAKDV